MNFRMNRKEINRSAPVLLTHVTLLAFTGMTFSSNENHKIPVILSGEYLYFVAVGEFPIKGHY